MLDTVPEQGHDYIYRIYRDKEAFNYVSRFDQSQKGKKDKILNYFIKEVLVCQQLNLSKPLKKKL